MTVVKCPRCPCFEGLHLTICSSFNECVMYLLLVSRYLYKLVIKLDAEKCGQFMSFTSFCFCKHPNMHIVLPSVGWHVSMQKILCWIFMCILTLCNAHKAVAFIVAVRPPAIFHSIEYCCRAPVTCSLQTYSRLVSACVCVCVYVSSRNRG